MYDINWVTFVHCDMILLYGVITLDNMYVTIQIGNMNYTDKIVQRVPNLESICHMQI